MSDQITPNGKQKSVAVDTETTVQARVQEDFANHFLTLTFTNPDCNIMPSNWWSEQRERELQTFFYLKGNDIIQSAFSSFVKKFRSMNYTVTGPKALAEYSMMMLLNSDFGKGLSDLLGRTVQTGVTSDKGAFWEILGPGDPSTPLAGDEVLGFAYLDNQYCILTGNVEHPVIFTNAKDKKSIKLHRTRVYHFVDMPSPNTRMHGVGFCALSRLIQSASIMLKLSKYKDEKLTDLPEAGMLLFNNVLPAKWDERQEEYEAIRGQKGQEYWKNLITLFGLDPTQPATAQFISFANTPDNFNEMQQTEMFINLLALSLGISPNELWSLSTGTTWNPTATEVTIQHQQAKNKGVGDWVTAFERAINWFILPASCQFKFDYVDDVEDRQATDINYQKIEAIMKMWRPATPEQLAVGIETPVPVEVIRKLLTDQVSWFDNEWIQPGVDDNIILTQVDAMKQRYGPTVTIDNECRTVKPNALAQKQMKRGTTAVLEVLEKKYKSGQIDIEEVLDCHLGDLIDKEIVE